MDHLQNAIVRSVYMQSMLSIQYTELIMCPRLDDPANGAATLENRTNGVDSLVSYGCSAGYTLVGSDSRTCLLNGTWTHSDPQCERMLT